MSTKLDRVWTRTEKPLNAAQLAEIEADAAAIIGKKKPPESDPDPDPDPDPKGKKPRSLTDIVRQAISHPSHDGNATINLGEWNEELHPRADDGKFTEGSGQDAGVSGRGTEREGRGDVPKAAAPGKARPDANVAVQHVADAYNREHGRGHITHGYVDVDQPRARAIADAYDAMPDDDRDNPAVKEAYAALSTEIQAQWDHAIAEGMTFEPWDRDGQPYQSSREMAEDVKRNKHLWFYTGGEPHPLLGEKDASGLSMNDKFRAVHDYFGHSAGGYGFGPRGEENAWTVHSQMLSTTARRALTTETRGQNSWVNFGRHNYNPDGSYKNIPAPDRPYAVQKVALLPDEFVRLPNETTLASTAYDMPTIADVSAPGLLKGISIQFQPRPPKKRKYARRPKKFEASLMSLSEIPDRLDTSVDRLKDIWATVLGDPLATGGVVVGAMLAMAHYGAGCVQQEFLRQGVAFKLAHCVFDLHAPAESLLEDFGADVQRALQDVQKRLIRRSKMRESTRRKWAADLIEARIAPLVSRYANRTINEGFAYGRTLALHTVMDRFDLARKDKDFPIDLSELTIVQTAILDPHLCSECEEVHGETFEYGSDRQLELEPPYERCKGLLGGNVCRCQQLAIIGKEAIDIAEVSDEELEDLLQER